MLVEKSEAPRIGQVSRRPARKYSSLVSFRLGKGEADEKGDQQIARDRDQVECVK